MIEVKHVAGLSIGQGETVMGVKHNLRIKGGQGETCLGYVLPDVRPVGTEV
jgi:hypothetical protein